LKLKQITPKALANFSPGLERSDHPWVYNLKASPTLKALGMCARMLFANLLVTTAFRESLFHRLSTPIGLILIVVGGYFLTKDYD